MMTFSALIQVFYALNVYVYSEMINLLCFFPDDDIFIQSYLSNKGLQRSNTVENCMLNLLDLHATVYT